MPNMDVRINCSVKGAEPVKIDHVVVVSQEELEQFIPPSPSGGAGGWAYAGKAEALVCSILKDELFQDEVTPIEDVEDLRRLGVTSLSSAFENKDRGMISMTSIYPN